MGVEALKNQAPENREKQLPPMEKAAQLLWQNKFTEANEVLRKIPESDPKYKLAQERIKLTQELLDKKSDLRDKIVGSVAAEVREAAKFQGQSLPPEKEKALSLAEEGVLQFLGNDFAKANNSWREALVSDPSNQLAQDRIAWTQNLIDSKNTLFENILGSDIKEAPDALQALFEQIEPKGKE